MDEGEQKVLRRLGDAFDEFKKLAPLHPSDLPDFVHHVHALQNIVLARAGLRALHNADKLTSKDHIS